MNLLLNRSNAVSRRFPLRLCEVLEREFVAVHGRLAAAPSWLLRSKDVRFEPLIAQLRFPLQDALGAPTNAIRKRLASRGLVIPASGPSNQEFEQRLLGALNEALRAPENLYDPTLLEAGTPARLLAELPGGDKSASSDENGDQAQLNRLLLEEAFSPDIVARVDTVRLDQLFMQIHELGGGRLRSAVCLSGGGIRSASYALGALQGLARCGVLQKFDYLSTVSGGGYVGSWLSCWIQRHRNGLSGVVDELREYAQQEPGDRTRKLESEPGPIRFLRDYSRFLNPKGGLFSADTWTWAGIYLRNLSLNWLVLIPLLMLIVMTPRLYAALLYNLTNARDNLFGPFFWTASVCAVLTLICVTVNRPSISDTASVSEVPAHRRRDQFMDRFKSQAFIIAFGVAPLLLFTLLLTLLVWWVPGSMAPLPWSTTWELMKEAPLAATPVVLPIIGFQHVVLWGELIVGVGWLISIMCLSRRGWIRSAQELLAMLVAGALTWFIIAELTDYAAHASGSPVDTFRVGDFALHAAHGYAMLAVPVVMLAVLAGMTLFIGMVSKLSWIEDEDREWWARFGAWAMIGIVAWLSLSVISILGPPLLLEFPKLVTTLGGMSGLLAVLLGKSSLSPATGRTNGKAAKPEAKNRVLALLGPDVLAVASVAFLAVFLAFLSLLSGALLKQLLDWLTSGHEIDTVADFLGFVLVPPGYAVHHACGHGASWASWRETSVFLDPQISLDIACQTPPLLLTATMFVFAAVVFVAGRAINLNKFSLHAAYRIRIVRTFLGASRGNDRRPNPFTGFDPLDNVQMHELLPGLLCAGDILDLTRLVEKLQSARLGKSGSEACDLCVKRMCSPENDPSGVLKNRLAEYQAGKPVLRALQQDVLEGMNRVIESSRLLDENVFAGSLAAKGERVRQFMDHGHLIFANRLLLEAAFEGEIRPYDFPPPPPHKLMHVLNLTLNLVHGRRLAWQERKAAPFTVTPMHSGSYYLGYRESRDYGGKEGISIGTAAAISGAAVSPNMGYSSSPVTASLLTLFNVRLGWWLGNPGIAGTNTYRSAEPQFSLRPLLSEALGLTDDRSAYVYLSDGGHFENMGLFEMVLRRCQLIVVTDAGADPDYQFEDLGNAVRKIRTDLGISIEFSAMPIHKRRDAADQTGRYCALGRIRYSAVDGPDAPDGVLICFKPVLCGNEPRDVLNYATQNEPFPQQPTADQFFGESQFESYRQLGQFAMETVCSASSADSSGEIWAASLVRSVRNHLGDTAGKNDWLDSWLTRATSETKSNRTTADPDQGS